MGDHCNDPHPGYWPVINGILTGSPTLKSYYPMRNLSIIIAMCSLRKWSITCGIFSADFFANICEKFSFCSFANRIQDAATKLINSESFMIKYNLLLCFWVCFFLQLGYTKASLVKNSVSKAQKHTYKWVCFISQNCSGARRAKFKSLR